jgi:hypothetical protein
MQPVLLAVNGTGTSAVVTPDHFQNPFAIAIGVNVSGTGNGTTIGWRIEHTFDFLDAPTATVTNWFLNSAIGTAGSPAATSVVALDMNYAFPVTGIRLNVATALATTTVQARIIQATNAP